VVVGLLLLAFVLLLVEVDHLAFTFPLYEGTLSITCWNRSHLELSSCSSIAVDDLTVDSPGVLILKGLLAPPLEL
jgi:hypothetical protein